MRETAILGLLHKFGQFNDVITTNDDFSTQKCQEQPQISKTQLSAYAAT